MLKRVADIVMDTLAENGIEQAFCVVGGGSMYLDNALGISTKIKTIFNHHEQACAMAAEGYARYKTNQMALVCVTSGPGGTNTLTGVYGAYVDSIPMIVISGQCRYNTSVPHSGLPLRSRGVQEFNIVDTVKTMTKYSKLIVNPLEVKAEVQKACKIAMSGRRGPVWLDIPLDVQNAMVDEDELLVFESQEEQNSLDNNLINKIQDLLSNAKRPVILAGSGIRYSGNFEAFLEFLQKVKIPVVNACCQPDLLYREHELCVGIEGLRGQRASNFVLQNADVLLVLGASLTYSETGWVPEDFAPYAHIIMVNIDEYEHQKPGLKVDTFVHADLKDFFACFDSVNIKAPQVWFDYAMNLKAKFDPFEGAQSEYARVNPYKFWQLYAKKAPNDAITCLGNSSSISGWLCFGNKKQGQRSFVNVNCGSMGDDLPLAIGVAAASNKHVFLETGDGSLMMNLQELATIIHNNLPIKIVVMSNGGYAAIRNTCNNYFNGYKVGCDAESGISLPNFKIVAEAFSIPYRKCSSNQDLDSALAWLFNRPSCAFLEVEQQFESVKAPSIVSKVLHDGKIKSDPLQDMFPYISRDDYNTFMIATKD